MKVNAAESFKSFMLSPNNKCYVFFPTEGYGGNLNFEKNEKE